MQVQSVLNNNPSFTALRINRPELEWNADVLLKFVKNKEVQKFVSGMDYLDRDIYASCLNGKTIDLEVMKKKSNSNIGIRLPQFSISAIKNFSSHEFYQAFEKLSCENDIKMKKIEEALRIANAIISNRSEAVVKNKRWWQIWK